MKNLTNIKDRILFFIENQGIKISKFYSESGVSYGILSQKSKITEDNIVRFLIKYPQVSAEWLLMGRGEMINHKVEQDTPRLPVVVTSNTPPIHEARIKELEQTVNDLRETIAVRRELIDHIKKDGKFLQGIGHNITRIIEQRRAEDEEYLRAAEPREKYGKK